MTLVKHDDNTVPNTEDKHIQVRQWECNPVCSLLIGVQFRKRLLTNKYATLPQSEQANNEAGKLFLVTLCYRHLTSE